MNVTHTHTEPLNAPRPSGREFPFLGASDQQATVATRARFFVTAPMLRITSDATGSPHVAGGPFHAKQMGTLLTACGVRADSWTKAWDVVFSTLLTPVCLECAAVERYITRPASE